MTLVLLQLMEQDKMIQRTNDINYVSSSIFSSSSKPCEYEISAGSD